MKARAIKLWSYDSPPKPYWVVKEVVTIDGYTIQWPGIHATEESANNEIKEEECRRQQKLNRPA